MDAEHAAVLLPLLTLVVGGGFALLVMALNENADTTAHKPTGRRQSGPDLERDHALGAHRQTPAWGCKECWKA